MSNRDSNYSARERVVHKLTGAAYQMTFCEEYDRAMGTIQRLYDETADLGALVIQMHHRIERAHSERNRQNLAELERDDHD